MTGYVSIPDRQLALSLSQKPRRFLFLTPSHSVQSIQLYKTHHVVSPITPLPPAVSLNSIFGTILTLAFPQQTHPQRPSRHSLSML